MPATAPATPTRTTMVNEHAELLTAYQNHLQIHMASLVEAARFTAGAPGARLARRLCADIAAASRWQSAFARRLRVLRGLLRLDHLDDPDTPYPIPVEVLELNSARVVGCCWHVEQLETLLTRSDTITARAARLPRIPVRRPMRTA